MSNRIPPGLGRTLVQFIGLVLVCLRRALTSDADAVPALVPAPSGPAPRPAVLPASAEQPAPYVPGWGVSAPPRPHLGGAHHTPTPRVRPYLRVHEQRARRTALVLALDGIDVGPRVIHGHRVGSAVGASAGVAA